MIFSRAVEKGCWQWIPIKFNKTHRPSFACQLRKENASDETADSTPPWEMKSQPKRSRRRRSFPSSHGKTQSQPRYHLPLGDRRGKNVEEKLFLGCVNPFLFPSTKWKKQISGNDLMPRSSRESIFDTRLPHQRRHRSGGMDFSRPPRSCWRWRESRFYCRSN